MKRGRPCRVKHESLIGAAWRAHDASTCAPSHALCAGPAAVREGLAAGRRSRRARHLARSRRGRPTAHRYVHEAGRGSVAAALQAIEGRPIGGR